MPETWGYKLQQLDGHTDTVTDLKFSPDGLILASGSIDGVVCLWDTQLWENLNILEGHDATVHSLSFSPDGSLLASASHDGMVILWNRKTGQVTSVLEHLEKVTYVDFSSDGLLVASISISSTIRSWLVSNGQEMNVWTGRDESVDEFTFPSTGSSLAFASGYTVHVWDARTGQDKHVYQGKNRCVVVIFSPNGAFLATGWEDGVIRIFPFDKPGKMLEYTTRHDSIQSLAFSPDSLLLASGSYNGYMCMWNLQNDTEMYRLENIQGSAQSLLFSHDGGVLAARPHGDDIKLWDASTGQALRVFDRSDNEIWDTIQFSPTEPVLVSYRHKTIILWDVAVNHEMEMSEHHQCALQDMQFSPDGFLLASTSANHRIKIWDTNTGRELRELVGHSGCIYKVTFNQDNSLLASAQHEKDIYVWNANTTEMILTIGVNEQVRQLTFLFDSSILASRSTSSIRLWDLRTGQEMRSISTHNPHYYDMVFFNNQPKFAIFNWTSISVYDAATGEVVWNRELVIESGRIMRSGRLAISADDMVLAVKGHDAILTVLDLRDGREIHRVSVNERIKRMEFVLDNYTLLTDDGWLQLNDAPRSSAELSILSNKRWVIEGDWLTYCGKNYLWLPEEYRGIRSIVCGNTIASQHPSGLVSIMKLKNPETVAENANMKIEVEKS